MKIEDTQTAAYQRAKAELLPGEELLWVGQPQRPQRAMWGGSQRSSKATVLAVVVGLQLFLVLGGAFFMVSGNTTSSVSVTTGDVVTTTETTAFPWIALLIGVIVLVGLVAGIAPLVWMLRKAKNTVYAITDRRALIISGKSVQSYGQRDIQFIKRESKRDGSGNLTFRREAHSAVGYYGGSVFAPRTQTTAIGFFDIPDVREVEELMLDVFRPEGGERKRKHDADWDEAGDYFYEEEEPGFTSDGRNGYRLS